MSYGGAFPRATNQYVAPKVNARPKVKLRVSYNLQNSDHAQHQRHCFGINSLALNDLDGHLYSAGRDSTIRSWDINKMPVPEHLSCFEHHTDWVNDVFLCNNNKAMVSCSSDASIKIWDTETAQCSRTLNRHGDYVKALSYAPQVEIFASAGLDTNIFVWDLQQCTAPVVTLTAPSSPSLSCSSGFRNNVAPTVRTGVEKGSLYSLTMNATASIVLSGSTERLIRAWDPRSGQKLFKLKGHKDNIKALHVNDEGTLCISGSSDFTMRLWDLRQQQCIHVFEVHDDGVWSVAVDPSFSNVYSGGRDGSVFVTDLVSSTSTLVCTEQFPIVKILHSKRDGDSLWVTTTDSCIKNWALKTEPTPQRRVYSPPPTLSSSPTTSSFQGSKAAPRIEAPRSTILGRPGMIKHHILNNRRHVLTKDSSGVVELWDITHGKQLESFGVVNFEKKVEEMTEIVSVPNWFSVDTKTGSLTVHLDYPQCFNAEVYAGDVFEDLPPGEEETQMNLGESVLRSLFSYWDEGRKALDAKYKHDPREKLPQATQLNLSQNQVQNPSNSSQNSLQNHSSTSTSHPQPNGYHAQSSDSAANSLKEDPNHLHPPPTSATLGNSSTTLGNSTTTLGNSTLGNSTLGNSTTLSNSSTLPKGSTNGVTSPATASDERPKLPPLSLPDTVSVIISEEGTGATMHRAMRNQFVGDEPTEIVPQWVVDNILHNEKPQTSIRALSVKLGFYLLTADEKELPALPQGTGRLSAARLLRIVKVAKYVVEKLDLELPLASESDEKSDNPETSGSSESDGSENGKQNEERIPPEQYVDILCNNKLLLPHYSLATVKAFFWKSGDENIVLHYKINPKYANTTTDTGGDKTKNTRKGSKSNSTPSKKQGAPKKSSNPFHRKT
eukprot:Phypoly_transcript_01771.p1 GENE.Phypoly_transcript_01771~~Phypoly_transcript_01771.p1  ORF type:complete len:891 (+),score=135.94 Phypoly_transcript_01771:81-2753(+)